MSDYTPQLGHRVRVVMEGEVTHRARSFFTLGRESDVDTVTESAPHVVSVERLPDPEPAWRPGDVALESKGHGRYVIRNHDGGWFAFGVLRSFEDSEVTRPLTPIARNGKLWVDATGGAS